MLITCSVTGTTKHIIFTLYVKTFVFRIMRFVKKQIIENISSLSVKFSGNSFNKVYELIDVSFTIALNFHKKGSYVFLIKF